MGDAWRPRFAEANFNRARLPLEFAACGQIQTAKLIQSLQKPR
jgi:hypothetical protein